MYVRSPIAECTDLGSALCKVNTVCIISSLMAKVFMKVRLRFDSELSCNMSWDDEILDGEVSSTVEHDNVGCRRIDRKILKMSFGK